MRVRVDMDSPNIYISFGRAFVTLLIVIDPVSIIPVLLALTGRLDARHARTITLKIVAGSTALLLLFIFAGTWLLSLFSITLDDMRIAGGLLLFIIAIRLVIEGRIGSHAAEDYQAAIVPLISPLMIGPGAITAAIVLAVIHGVVITALAAVAVMLLSLILFLSTRLFCRLLGDSGADLVSRVMGVLIAAIAVSYVRLGVLGMVGK